MLSEFRFLSIPDHNKTLWTKNAQKKFKRPKTRTSLFRTKSSSKYCIFCYLKEELSYCRFDALSSWRHKNYLTGSLERDCQHGHHLTSRGVVWWYWGIWMPWIETKIYQTAWTVSNSSGPKIIFSGSGTWSTASSLWHYDTQMVHQ